MRGASHEGGEHGRRGEGGRCYEESWGKKLHLVGVVGLRGEEGG